MDTKFPNRAASSIQQNDFGMLLTCENGNCFYIEKLSRIVRMKENQNSISIVKKET